MTENLILMGATLAFNADSLDLLWSDFSISNVLNQELVCTVSFVLEPDFFFLKV